MTKRNYLMRSYFEMRKMRVFGVSGYSGTGKTTLVEAIIRSLIKSGHSVATVKSSKHEAGPNQGTDTWRHMQAGASMTIFLGPKAESGKFTDRIGSDELVRLSNYEFLIVEGMKSANIPKFWCVGDTELKHDDIPVNTQAIVSWSDKAAIPGLDLPIFIADEIDELVKIVKIRSLDISEIQ
ncbi:MAG: Molybdopterin-guanine dinucleotide biosynthesis adapter protein [Candidatus Thorarchaeota archaeon AB_25]|jgi:molybdopterin-guanine dinucleotide biosynthesis protein MobB|nr:MAG: Molybdopterin-guanine dinucleotide biosynthesis adapter protein [Candidatus Thorarchaeota archaeon AB_25]